MLIFPQLPSPGAFRQAMGYQVFFIVVAAQRNLDAVGGFAHET
jgi:hypothetical protein